MSGNRHLIALAITAAVAASQNVVAQEEDSAYQWGRWAVLSPAAGGQPYQAPLEPGAANNYRPNDYFDVNVLAGPPIQPIVVPNPPGNGPPVGDPRGGGPINVPPVVVPSPGGQPPGGGPRGGSPRGA